MVLSLTSVPVVRLCLAEAPTILGMGTGTHAPGEPHRWRMSGWCLHFYPYQAELRLDGVALPIRPGFASILPPESDLDYRFKRRCSHVSVHFRTAAGPAHWVVGVMQDLQQRYRALDQGIREAVSWGESQPLRARVRLWDVLLEMAHLDTGGDPLVDQARQMIELRLSQPISVESLARELGCSHNHLTRLFRRELHSTVIGWVRRRRASQAHHLLVSTSMPIGAVGAEVGIPDPHLFNKVIRRELGIAPRQLRQRGY